MMHNALWIGFIGLLLHATSAQPGVTLNLKNAYGDEVSKKCIQWLHDSDNSLYLTEFLHANFPHLLEPNQKQLLAERKELCKKVWLSYLSVRLNKGESADEYSKWIWWVSDQQKMELTKMRENRATFTEIHDKMNEHFNELNSTMRQKLMNEYKEKCMSFFATMGNDMEKMSLEASYDAQNYDQLSKIIGEIANHQTGEMHRQTEKFALICKEVYQNLNSRTRRDLDQLIQKHLSWLSSAQRDEIKQMKNNGQSVDEIRSRLVEFVKGGGDNSVQKTKESCYSWLQEVTTAEERAELHKFHETDHSACKIKVREYIKRLSPDKQMAVKRDLAVCEQIWYGMHEHGHHIHHHHEQHRMARQTDGKRFKRHPHHTLDEYMEHHLQWLSDAQKEELRKMKSDGKSKSEMQKLVMGFYEGLEGESKRHATERLKIGCRELLNETLDTEQLEKLRALKESGATVDEMSAKIEEFASNLADEGNKQKINEYLPACKTIYKAGKQYHSHKIEGYFKTHLQWLSEEQRDEVRNLANDGKSKLEINEKLLEFYKKLGESEQKAAAKQVVDGCTAMLEKIVGKDNVTHLKATFDAGATIPEVKAIAEEMFKSLDDVEKQKKFNDYRSLCGEVLEKVEKKHLESLEYHLKRHLKWLSDEQKKELKEMDKDNKTKTEIQEKIIEFFDGTTGDTKVKAIEGLQDGCRESLEELFSKENVKKLRKLRQSGATAEEAKAKIQEIADKLDDDKKTKFKASIVCSRRFETLYKHHRVDEGPLEHYFETYLSWLNDDQRAKLREMKKDGESKLKIEEQIFSFYEHADDDHKKDIIEKLADGCKCLIGPLLGEDNTKQLKQMRDNHATFEELKAKAAEMAEKIDPEKKQKLAYYMPGCERILKIKHEQTKDYVHTLERYLKTSLSWLSDEQKKELRDMEESLKQSINAKIAHFLELADQETKTQAVKSLKGGCGQLVRNVLGDEGTELLRQMRDEGKTFDEITGKYNELIAHVADGHQKQKAEIYKPICSLIHKYSLEASSTKSRFKRDSQAHWLADLGRNTKVLSFKLDGRQSEKLDESHTEHHITIKHTPAEKLQPSN